MKIGLILTGLQRNCEPFIKNQYKLLIEKNQCDVFIFTSDSNYHLTKVPTTDNVQKDESFENGENFFLEKYSPYLKKIVIDKNDNLFKKHFQKYQKANIPPFHNHLLQAYFKVFQGIQMLKNYEKKHSFQYDCIVRARLDGFLLRPFDITKLDLSKNQCYISKANNHRDDSITIFHRKHLHILESFLETLEEQINYWGFGIHIEWLLFWHFKQNKLSIVTIPDLYLRIGTKHYLWEVPYTQKNDLKKIKSINQKFSIEPPPLHRRIKETSQKYKEAIKKTSQKYRKTIYILVFLISFSLGKFL